MRVMDGLMSIPSVLLAIALMALTKASIGNVIVAITLAEVPRVVRLVRSLVLTLREQPYVEAAIAAGTTPAAHPGAPHPAEHRRAAARAGTYVCGSAMITEAILSFIGAGTPPNIPSWGNIMAEGRSLIQIAGYLDPLSRHLPVADGARGEPARRRHARRARPAARAPHVTPMDARLRRAAARSRRAQDLFLHARRRRARGRRRVVLGRRAARRSRSSASRAAARA